jgi:Holliday junction resolvase
MMTPEGHEKKAIKKYLDSIGAWHFSPSMTGFGKSGVPDIIGSYKGFFFAIEVKREGKKPTPIQELRMKKIEKAVGKTFWGTASKVTEEFIRWKNALDDIWEIE